MLFAKKRPKFTKIFTAVLSGLLLMGSISSCQKPETEKKETETSVKQQFEKVSNERLPEIEKYLDSIVNGNFREFKSFPYFNKVSEIPAIVFSSGNILQEASKKFNTPQVPRSEYEKFLQDYFGPAITLPSSANYVRGYNSNDDSFNAKLDLSTRNFYPSSFWKDASISQEDDKIYFDAYEFNYEFVNTDTGSSEHNNPIARILVDEVTIGFSSPIVKRDLYLIDHAPLAKTRYTLKLNADGNFNLISKTRLSADEAYKQSAMTIYQNAKAVLGSTKNLGGSSIAVVNAPERNSKMLATLLEGTSVWYIDVFPNKEYYLFAPASNSAAIFDYRIGFGYGFKEYIG